MTAGGYELLDLAAGRKLERFGEAIVVRPDAAADGAGVAWKEAHAEFDRKRKRWSIHRALPDPWTVRIGDQEFLLEPAAGGQVGAFPEQAPLRERLGAAVAEAIARGRSARVLDLFGYTGGSAMACARAGADVTFVDAARGSVAWARRNFGHNGLGAAALRSIAEDAAKFVAREARRRTRYDAIVLDPPSFGRGPGGATWSIERDLDGLLHACAGLLSDEPLLVLVTAHTVGWSASALRGRLRGALAGRKGRFDAGELALRAATGGTLRAGIFARWEAA